MKKGEISVEPDTLLFDSNGECYVVVNGSGYGTSLSKIDFEKNKLTEIYKLDYRIKSICEGFGKYDVCFIFDDGVYGYSIKNNTIKEPIAIMANITPINFDSVVITLSALVNNTAPKIKNIIELIIED